MISRLLAFVVTPLRDIHVGSLLRHVETFQDRLSWPDPPLPTLLQPGQNEIKSLNLNSQTFFCIQTQMSTSMSGLFRKSISCHLGTMSAVANWRTLWRSTFCYAPLFIKGWPRAEFSNEFLCQFVKVWRFGEQKTKTRVYMARQKFLSFMIP